MPSLQSFATSFSNIFGGNHADIATAGAGGADKKSASDQFSSLLDVVGNVGDGSNNKQVENSKKDDVKEPVAVAVTTPAAFRDNNKDTIKDSTKKVDDNDNAPQKLSAALDNRNNKDDARKPDKADSTTSKDSAQAAGSDKKTDKLSGKANNDNSSDDKDSGNVDVASELDKLKEKIADKVDSLSDLLGIISRLLAGANGAVANIDVSIVQQSQTQITVTGDNENTAIVGDGQATDALAVFANLKDVLSQLEQFLQAAKGQGTPLTEEQNTNLTAINNALQNDLNALKSLFPQAGINNKGDTQSIFNQLLQAQQTTQPQENVDSATVQTSFTQVGDVKSLLQDDIALIKAALLKFKNDGINAPAKIESEAPKFQVQAQPLISDTVANNNIKQVRTDNSKADSAVFSSVSVIAAVDQPVVNQGIQIQNSNSSTPAAIAVQSVIGSESDSSSSNGGFSNNSGQGGNSQAQISLGALGATSTRSAGGAASTQFSNLLNRADQVPVSEQVVFHVKSAIGSGNSKISIQLHPEDLGKLDITLDVDSKGKTGVTITADNKQTLDLLQRDSSGLQKALADAGLKTDSGSLSFNLRGGEKEGQGQNQYQAASQYQKSQQDEILPEELNIASLAAVTRSYTINVPDGLDIKI